MYRKRKAAHRAGKVQLGGVKEGRSSELFRKGYVLRSRAEVRFSAVRQRLGFVIRSRGEVTHGAETYCIGKATQCDAKEKPCIVLARSRIV